MKMKDPWISDWPLFLRVTSVWMLAYTQVYNSLIDGHIFLGAGKTMITDNRIIPILDFFNNFMNFPKKFFEARVDCLLCPFFTFLFFLFFFPIWLRQAPHFWRTDHIFQNRFRLFDIDFIGIVVARAHVRPDFLASHFDGRILAFAHDYRPLLRTKPHAIGVRNLVSSSLGLEDLSLWHLS